MYFITLKEKNRKKNMYIVLDTDKPWMKFNTYLFMA